MGIQITGSNDTIQAADGNLSIEGVSLNFNHENVTGISTMATGHITGTATIDDDLKVGISTLFVDVSAARIGIGTNVPDASLSIGDGSSTTYMSLKAGTSNSAVINFGDTADDNIGQFYYYNGDNSFRWTTNAAADKMTLDSSGRLLIGQTSADTDLGGYLQIVGNSYAASSTLQARLTADAHAASIDLLKSRNTTWGTHTIVQSGDRLGSIYFRGDDGVNYSGAAAQISGEIDGTPGADDLPGRLIFCTSADGADAPTERLRIDKDGHIFVKGSNHAVRFYRDDEARYGAITYTGSNFNIMNPANDHTQITNSGGTAIIKFHNGGNILYGDHMNDRGAELQYEGSQHNQLGLHRNTADHGAPAMTFSASRGTSAGSNTIVQDDDYLGLINFSGADGSDLANGAYITGIVDGTPGSNDMPTRLALWTSADGSESPSERVRVDSSGRMIIARSGTAGDLNSHDATLHVTAPTDGGQGGIYIHCNSQSAGTAAAHYGLKIDAVNCANNANPQCGAIINVVQQYTASETGIKMSVEGSYNTTTCYEANLTKNLAAITNGYSYYSNIVTTNSGGNAYHFRGQDDGALAIYILENGNIQNANNSYGSTSDLKLKENIVDASSQWNDIKNVKVRKFNFKTKPSETFIGVVAQEIETTSPGLVHTENDIEVTDAATGIGTITGTTKSVKYSILYMKAIKALQEAMTRIETLETKVAALESA